VAAVRAVGGAPATIDWPEWQDDLPGNVLGQAHALTAFAPMPWWQAVLLKLKLTLLKVWPNLALPRHHFVYFGRWTILRRPPGTGKRGDCYVLIETNYNGSFAEYIDTIATDLQKYMVQIWGPCYGCPPHIHPPGAFRQYARRHELPAQHYFSAYPDATVKEIEAALKVVGDLPAPDPRSAGEEGHTRLVAARAEAQMAVRERQKMTWRRRLRAILAIIWPDRASPVSAVTTLTPILPGQLEPLKGYLADLDRDVRENRIESPFKNVEGTHFARWVVVDQLQNEGRSEAPLDLHPPGLLFGAIGDGKPGAYLDRLCAGISDRGRDVWVKHCEGLHGPRGADASALKRYLNDSRLRGGLLDQGYEADVRKVKEALAATRRERGPEAPRAIEDPLGTSVTAVRPNDLRDLQGNVVRGYYPLPFAAFLLVRADDPARGCAGLKALIDRALVTTAKDQQTAKDREQPLGRAWNVAFTFDGLRALGVPERLLTAFPQDFRDGMQKRAERLGDFGASHPETWESGLTEAGGGHAMLMLRADSRDARDDAHQEARRLLRDHELVVVYEEICDPLPVADGGPREHFGFADGFSQPAIEGTPAADRDPDHVIKAGELLLGYLDEEGELPGKARFFRNGSFMVFRKLEQRVAAFRQVVAANAGDLSKEELSAKIVGRWPDGAPLVLKPTKEEGEKLDPRSFNDFRYGSPADGGDEAGDGDRRADDPHGFHCPLGAHIRRTFPRDALVGGATRTRRHRVLRRGMPYGSPLPAGTPPRGDDDRGRGLLFICFNASIARQFETVQSWCLDGNLFDVPGEPDFLLGPESATMTVQTKPPGPPRVLTRSEELVVTRGGGYFFYPSISALTAIATRDYLGQDDPLRR
jgi:Dyp-type peroxidase family